MVRCRSARDKPFFAISPRFRAQALPPRPFPFATSDRAARCRGAAPVRSSDAHRRSCWRALDARSRTPRRSTACQAQRSICRAVSPTVTGRVAPATSRRQCPVTCMTTAVTADVIGLSAIHWPITAAATSSTAAGAAHDRNPCHRILLLPTHCQELIPPPSGRAARGPPARMSAALVRTSRQRGQSLERHVDALFLGGPAARLDAARIIRVGFPAGRQSLLRPPTPIIYAAGDDPADVGITTGSAQGREQSRVPVLCR